MNEVALRIENVSKSFPGVKALDKVSLQVKKGEIHALVGENGAGKSTLVNIIMGMFPPDEGKMFLGEKEIFPKTPHEAQNLGIGIVPQELQLVPYLTVAENILLGTSTNKKFFSRIEWKSLFLRAEEFIELLNIGVDPKEKTSRLSPAQQELVQVARVLAWDCNILILDEPTASFTSDEVNNLFSILRRLKMEGKTIIYICHKLEEVFEISDRITVLRDGKCIATVSTEKTSRNEIIEYMVGRTLDLEERIPRKGNTGDIALEVKNIKRKGLKGENSFYVKKGEIVGFAGLVGAGRTELMKVIFGAEKAEEGEILFQGKKVNISSPSDAVLLGIGFIPEERKTQGILPMLSVKANISLPIIDDLSSKLGFISSVKENDIALEFVKKLNIKTPSINQKIAYLSGGNQQKVIIARWLARNCDLVIFDEPTRGIDVGAKKEIHLLIRSLADSGVATIVISSEFSELFAITDRLYVMKDNLIISEFITEETSQEEIMDTILKQREERTRSA